MEELSEALAEYDAQLARCPVNNFQVDRRVYGPKDSCSSCGQTASGGCGKHALASWRLIQTVRRMCERDAANRAHHLTLLAEMDSPLIAEGDQ